MSDEKTASSFAGKLSRPKQALIAAVAIACIYLSGVVMYASITESQETADLTSLNASLIAQNDELRRALGGREPRLLTSEEYGKYLLEVSELRRIHVELTENPLSRYAVAADYACDYLPPWSVVRLKDGEDWPHEALHFFHTEAKRLYDEAVNAMPSGLSPESMYEYRSSHCPVN